MHFHADIQYYLLNPKFRKIQPLAFSTEKKQYSQRLISFTINYHMHKLFLENHFELVTYTSIVMR
jgi:hypothetical protein